MIKPAKLKKGDTIGIVAPASSFDRENFDKGIKVLRGLGYKVKYERNIFNKCWSEPGHNKQRANQINRMFADKGVKAILCAKAGYGSEEIIAYLDHTVIKENPKIFVGYSDITILLLYFQHIADMVVFHGPVVSGEFFRGMNPHTIDSFIRLISESRKLGKVHSPYLKVFQHGKASGTLVGGNLTLMLKSLDTFYQLNTENKILFIEEISESLNEIYLGLKELKEKGKLSAVRGVVFGRMTDCYENEGQFKRCLKKIFHGVKFPVVYNFPAGHVEDMAHSHISLPLGLRFDIDSEKLSVEIKEAAVQ